MFRTKFIRRISVRLFLAFGILALTTLITVMVAWLAFSRISDQFFLIADKQLPATASAAKIADVGGAIRLLGSKFLVLGSQAERKNVRNKITLKISELEEIINNSLAQDEDQPFKVTSKILPDLKRNLLLLDENVHARFKLLNRKNDALASLQWAHTDFLDEIEPLLLDINSKDDFDRYFFNDKQAILRLNANINLLNGLVIRGAFSDDLSEVEQLREHITAVVRLLEAPEEKLSLSDSTYSLFQAVNEIKKLSLYERDILNLRKQEILYTEKARKIILENSDFFKIIEYEVALRISSAEKSASAATIKAEKSIVRERLFLSIAALIVIAVFLLVTFGYVRKRIINRLSNLRHEMSKISEGYLDTPIDTSGHDEISEMADALLIFRNTAQELENSQSQTIIDNTLVGMVITNIDKKIEFVNDRACELFSIDPIDIKGKDFSDVFLKSGQQNILEPLFFKRHESFSEVLGVRQGKEFYLDLAVRKITVRKKSKYLITLTDATDRHQVQELLEQRIKERTRELIHVNETLEGEIAERKSTQQELIQAAKLATLGEMSVGMAHEINQTLAAITYNTHNAETLLVRGEYDQAATFIKKIALISQRMGKTVNHLKVFARKPEKNIKSILVVEPLKHALSLFEEQISKENIQITKEGWGDNTQILGETVRLEQIFVNLIYNAMDAMIGLEHKQLLIEITESSEQVMVSFHDNGCGMDDITKKRLFEPFYTTKTTGKGLGLGMSITQKLAKDFNGHIEVDSSLGRGTRVTCIFNQIDNKVYSEVI